jgi:monoamine oxidase
VDDVGRAYGEAAREALAEFDAKAKHWMSPQEYYDSDWSESNHDPMACRTFYDELAQVRNVDARRFIEVLVHSDVATEPHRTSAAYGLQNYLMNDPEYLSLYTIDGGIERLPQELAARVGAAIRLREPVLRIERQSDATLRVTSRRDAKTVAEEYDFVVVALPNIYLSSIQWGGAALREAIHRHSVHYDHPAHYLRISVLFQRPFWKGLLDDSYLMLDAFGGCCLYDESSRNGCETYGVLGWLLAGDAAVIAANHSDGRLVEMMLDALPSFLRHGRELFVEGQVHRWIGSVNGLPGGSPALDMEKRHIPQPELPNLFLVGDYLFDSTLNGVLDSADYVAECIAEATEVAAAPLAAQSVPV